MLDRLTPPQRQALMIGAPVAAALAIGSVIARRDTPAVEDEEAATGTVPGYPANTDAIGVGELTQWTDAIGTGIAAILARLPTEEQAVPIPRPTAPRPPAPKPVPGPLPWRGPGERTADRALRPNHPGQVWYLSNLGGVQALGHAPFFGSAYNGGRGDERFHDIRADGPNAYYLISNKRTIRKGR